MRWSDKFAVSDIVNFMNALMSTDKLQKVLIGRYTSRKDCAVSSKVMVFGAVFKVLECRVFKLLRGIDALNLEGKSNVNWRSVEEAVKREDNLI